jgi:hypothetical protein
VPPHQLGKRILRVPVQEKLQEVSVGQPARLPRLEHPADLRQHRGGVVRHVMGPVGIAVSLPG